VGDHVRVCKREYENLGGGIGDDTSYIDEIDPHEDHPDIRGLYFQADTGPPDEVVHATRDASGRWVVRDSENTEYLCLSDLVAGAGGITAEGHAALRQLIHFIPDGPGVGFATGAHKETIGGLFPTQEIWWESTARLKKIFEKVTTYNGSFPSNETWHIYDTDGTSKIASASDSITYSGAFETGRTRTITVY